MSECVCTRDQERDHWTGRVFKLFPNKLPCLFYFAINGWIPAVCFYQFERSLVKWICTYSFWLWKSFSEKHFKFLKMKTSIRNLFYFNKSHRNPKSPIRGQNPRTRKECKTRFTCQTVIMKRGKVFLARSIGKGYPRILFFIPDQKRASV